MIVKQMFEIKHTKSLLFNDLNSSWEMYCQWTKIRSHKLTLISICLTEKGCFVSFITANGTNWKLKIKFHFEKRRDFNNHINVESVLHTAVFMCILIRSR